MKQRIDTLLVNYGIAESREQAQRMIMAGTVFINEDNHIKAGHKVDDERVKIRVVEKERYVSRGGMKLEGVLEDSGISIDNKICCDIGTSTGGFSDCLLQHGAKIVYAVDVGKSQIHERLRNDKRIVLCENQNAKYLTETTLPEKPDIVVIDVSFISLTKILAGVHNICDRKTVVISLIKPQFEATMREVGKNKGIITDPFAHFRILCTVLNSAYKNGFLPLAVYSCRLKGVQGNHEWFVCLKVNDSQQDVSLSEIMNQCMEACQKRWQDISFLEAGQDFISMVAENDI